MRMSDILKRFEEIEKRITSLENKESLVLSIPEEAFEDDSQDVSTREDERLDSHKDLDGIALDPTGKKISNPVGNNKVTKDTTKKVVKKETEDD